MLSHPNQFAAQQVLGYIMNVSGEKAGTAAPQHLKNKLIDSSPILEAMGNAKTLRWRSAEALLLRPTGSS